MLRINRILECLSGYGVATHSLNLYPHEDECQVVTYRNICTDLYENISKVY